jgi:hypothetical protein
MARHAVFEEIVVRVIFLYFRPHVLHYFQSEFIGVEKYGKISWKGGKMLAISTAAKPIKHTTAFTKY